MGTEGRPIVLGLHTLAMGDSMAVELAQTADLGILIQLGLLSETNLLAMGLLPPRDNVFGGVVIDDLQRLHCCLLKTFTVLNRWLEL